MTTLFIVIVTVIGKRSIKQALDEKETQEILTLEGINSAFALPPTPQKMKNRVSFETVNEWSDSLD